jgi:hypothetical protein
MRRLTQKRISKNTLIILIIIPLPFFLCFLCFHFNPKVAENVRYHLNLVMKLRNAPRCPSNLYHDLFVQLTWGVHVAMSRVRMVLIIALFSQVYIISSPTILSRLIYICSFTIIIIIIIIFYYTTCRQFSL